MALPTGTAGVFAPVNIAGLLLAKTDVRTPLFNMLGGVTHGAREFLTGAEYELDSASQPEVTETDSVTAPTPSYTTRTQAKNVTQMLHRAVSVTYRKQSNTQALTGLNLQGLTNNVPSELAFQIAGRTAEVRNDMEYTILQGTYNLATTADTADKTRGLNEAIETNVIAAASAELTPDILIEVAQTLASVSPYGVAGVLGVLNAEQIVQLNKIVTDEGQRVTMSEAGSNLLTYLTPFGRLNFLEGGHRYQTNGTATFVNISRCRNVFQSVPEKGNFFYEALAKTGAAERGQIFGQWGLDHGHEWIHAKVTGLATSTAATTAPKVFIDNDSDNPVYTDEVS
ncbi:MAG: DUF5309 family protein [Deltaproteobacteria bacterium]|nr:DUF5309 family protein [Deltaproteobacteria bacterium]